MFRTMFSKKLLAFASFLIWVLQGWAQFNPPNPQEPAITYKVELACDPENIAGLQGDGNYQDGSTAWISTYSWNGNYQFQYWELDGKVYSRSSSFTYTLCTRDVKFIAHYKYCPEDPADPNAVFMRRVFLKSEPENVATFNCSNGQKYERNSMQYFSVYGKWGYKFQGWYNGDELLGTENDLWFTIPDKDVTLTARFRFDPTNPSDPSNFFSTSCDITVASSKEEKGTVSVDGLENGRAIYGQTVTIYATPADDCVFCGWYNNDELVSEEPIYSFVASSLYKTYNLTALFLKNPHRVTYVLNDDEYSSFLVETGARIPEPDNLTKDGYTFSGWTGWTEVMPDFNVTVTGRLILSKIRMSSASLKIQGGDYVRLSVYEGDTSHVVVDDVRWSVDHQDVALVVRNGIVIGRNKGSALVRATYQQNEELVVTCVVDVQSSNPIVELPDVDFEFNYNAGGYDSQKRAITNDIRANLAEYSLVMDGNDYSYSGGKALSITGYTEGFIDRWSKDDLASGQYFSRINDDELTIICKVSSRDDNSSNKSDIVCNGYGTSINYSFRVGYRNSFYLASRYSYANRFLKYDSGQEQIYAVRVKGGMVLLQNLTTGQTMVLNQNIWGSQNGPMKLFYSDADNYFVGDFYWIYLSNNSLSDSEMWDVVDHNEGVPVNSWSGAMSGDANNSGSVNVTDISVTSDYLFGYIPAVFSFKNADVNKSRAVNVADIAGIASLIYGGTPVMKARIADRTQSDQLPEVKVTCDSLVVGGIAELSVVLNSRVPLSALELDIDLPSGVVVTDIRSNQQRCQYSTVRGGYVDGKYKVVLYSVDNTPFVGTEGQVLSVSVTADATLSDLSCCSIGVSDIILSETGNEIMVPGYGLTVPVYVPTSVTASPEDNGEYIYYDLSGRKIDGNSRTGISIAKDSNSIGKVFKVK